MTTTISRRRFLVGAGVGAGALAVGVASPFSSTRFAFAEEPTGADVVVCLFLRGGADALNLVVPHTDGAYYDLRGPIAIPERAVLPLEGGGGLAGFGLHPALAGLQPAWDAGHLAIVHASGLPASVSATRSHFEAEANLERGTADVTVPTGWLGRHLATTVGGDLGIPAVGHGTGIQASLRGESHAVSVSSIPSFGVVGYRDNEGVRGVLQDLYLAQGGVLGEQAQVTAAAVNLLRSQDPQRLEVPGPYEGIDARFAPVAAGLRETAAMIRSSIGLRAACIDFPDWDMHAAMGDVDGGRLKAHATGLGDVLGAFHEDLGPDLDRVTLVVVSEFGRCIRINASGGTDHGRGGITMVLGGNVNKGIWGDYPDGPLADGPEGDLAVANDLRAVLTEVLTKRAGNPDASQVFPGYQHRGDLGVVR
jgi:uncharacterized protein (DUF1501 family)